MSFHSKSGWDPNLPALRVCCNESASRDQMCPPVGTQLDRSVHYYRCGICNDRLEASTWKGFDYFDLDLKLKCLVCDKQTGLKNWLCPCGLQWFRCPTHHGVCETVEPLLSHKQCTPRTSSSGQRKVVPVRKLPTYEQLLEEDLRKIGYQRLVSPKAVLLDTGLIPVGQTARVIASSVIAPILCRRSWFFVPEWPIVER